MKTHLNVVGLLDVVAGVFFTIMAVLISLGVLLFARFFNGAPVWKPEDAPIVVALVLSVSAVFFVLGIPSLIAGIGLLRYKRWARNLAIVLAFLALAFLEWRRFERRNIRVAGEGGWQLPRLHFRSQMSGATSDVPNRGKRWWSPTVTAFLKFSRIGYGQPRAYPL